jgi:hypothetical protein
VCVVMVVGPFAPPRGSLSPQTSHGNMSKGDAVGFTCRPSPSANTLASVESAVVMACSASANRSSSLSFKFCILRSGIVACATSRHAAKAASLA